MMFPQDFLKTRLQQGCNNFLWNFFYSFVCIFSRSLGFLQVYIFIEILSKKKNFWSYSRRNWENHREIPEKNAWSNPGKVSEAIPERIPGDISDGTFFGISEDTAGRIPEVTSEKKKIINKPLQESQKELSEKFQYELLENPGIHFWRKHGNNSWRNSKNFWRNIIKTSWKNHKRKSRKKSLMDCRQEFLEKSRKQLLKKSKKKLLKESLMESVQRS